ncbi:MAG: hypothetical protein DRO18_00180 [Thermoprotei archaeon]|nr:MAG: hypothetical protein DRO18_00180 [Thermoprotei archaeon]
MVSNKVIYALSIVVIILLIVNAYLITSFIGLQNRTTELANAVSEVSSGLSDVNERLNEVLSKIEELTGKLSELASKYEVLSSDVAKVKEEVSSKVSEVKEGLSSLDEVVKSLAIRVGEEIKGLKKLHEELREEVRDLISSVKYPMVVTDALGRTVVIPYEPMRVVSVAPSITEIIFGIGAGDKVVGVDEYSNYPPEVMELREKGVIEVVGGFATLNIEKIIALNPDLVVMVKFGAQIKHIDALAKVGIPVLVLSDESVEEIFRSILILGVVLNKPSEAIDLVITMRTELLSIHEKVSTYLAEHNLSKLRVYFEVWPDPLGTIGNASFINDIITLAGGINVFGNESWSYSIITPEEVIARAPDVIVTTTHGGLYGGASDVLEMIMTRPGWDAIPAVKNGRVYVFTGEYEDIMVRPGPRVVKAVEALAKVLYPEAFGVSPPPNIIS